MKDDFDANDHYNSSISYYQSAIKHTDTIYEKMNIYSELASLYAMKIELVLYQNDIIYNR